MHIQGHVTHQEPVVQDNGILDVIVDELKGLSLLAVVTILIWLQASPEGRFWNVIIFLSICVFSVVSRLMRERRL